MKRIDFEAHFLTEEYIDALHNNKGFPQYKEVKGTKDGQLCFAHEVILPLGDRIRHKLLDIGEGRLKDMDANGVDVQVLSLTAPGLEQFDAEKGTALSKKTNDLLAEAIQKHPDRFMGFAALAPQNPEGATHELERAVKELGFKGWNTHSNYAGAYLDDKKYLPLLEKAAELDALIYLHPTVPAIPQLCKYGFTLAGAAFGFGFETAMCMMRVILSGVFDRYPGLKFMLGHYGEALPFLMERIDRPYTRSPFPTGRPELAKKPSEYLKSNVFMTTSGNFFEPAFMCTSQAMGIDRIFLGIDSPYEQMDQSLQFIENLAISQEDKEKIYYRNAAQLGIKI